MLGAELLSARFTYRCQECHSEGSLKVAVTYRGWRARDTVQAAAAERSSNDMDALPQAPLGAQSTAPQHENSGGSAAAVSRVFPSQGPFGAVASTLGPAGSASGPVSRTTGQSSENAEEPGGDVNGTRQLPADVICDREAAPPQALLGGQLPHAEGEQSGVAAAHLPARANPPCAVIDAEVRAVAADPDSSLAPSSDAVDVAAVKMETCEVDVQAAEHISKDVDQRCGQPDTSQFMPAAPARTDAVGALPLENTESCRSPSVGKPCSIPEQDHQTHGDQEQPGAETQSSLGSLHASAICLARADTDKLVPHGSLSSVATTGLEPKLAASKAGPEVTQEPTASACPPKRALAIKLPPRHACLKGSPSSSPTTEDKRATKKICIGPPGGDLSRTRLEAPPKSSDGGFFDVEAHDSGAVAFSQPLSFDDVTRLVHMLMLAHMSVLGLSVESVKQGLTKELEHWKEQTEKRDGLSDSDNDALNEMHPYLHVSSLSLRVVCFMPAHSPRLSGSPNRCGP